MKPFLRALVRSRAGGRCEYCRLHEADLPLYPFHVEHIVAKKHHGEDDARNLAWSCHECNLAKSSNLSGRDFVSGRIVALFNPPSATLGSPIHLGRRAACRVDGLRTRNH
jgi:5-methylcytosine-specific restriction endonuclease McrA